MLIPLSIVYNKTNDPQILIAILYICITFIVFIFYNIIKKIINSILEKLVGIWRWLGTLFVKFSTYILPKEDESDSSLSV